MSIPNDLAALPMGTILAAPGRCGCRFYVRGCDCGPPPQGGASLSYAGHAGTVEAEACAQRVLARTPRLRVAVAR